MECTFVVTREKQLLEQYYRLREACFRAELGIPDFDGGEDQYDSDGTVLLAVGRGGHVLAGARIYGNHPGQGRCLPIENQRFRLRNFFPALELNRQPYCQWGRLVIHPLARGRAFARQFLARLLDLTAALDYRRAFIISDTQRSRYYRQLHLALGYDFHISPVAPQVQEPGTDGLEQVLSYALLPSGDSVPCSPSARRQQFLQGLGIAAGQEPRYRPLRLVDA